MKYVLGLSFEFKYYKNPANIKIFSNNQLIDDIDLTKDIGTSIMTPIMLCKNIPVYNNWYYPWWNTKKQFGINYKMENITQNTRDLYKTIPEKIFVYTLDEAILQDSIKIQITNDNSNYTNGFMTRSSTITFRHIFLIPTYYLNLEHYALFSTNAKGKDWIINEAIGNEEKFKKAKDPQGRRSLHWPDEHRFVKNGQLFEDYGDETLRIDDATMFWRDQARGGSFSIKLPIIEYIHQKGLKMLGPINYEQLLEKEERYLLQSDVCPLYFNHFNLINTQNETA